METFPDGDISVTAGSHTYRVGPNDVATPLKANEIRSVTWNSGFENFDGKIVAKFPNGDFAIQSGESLYRHAEFGLKFPDDARAEVPTTGKLYYLDQGVIHEGDYSWHTTDRVDGAVITKNPETGLIDYKLTIIGPGRGNIKTKTYTIDPSNQALLQSQFESNRSVASEPQNIAEPLSPKEIKPAIVEFGGRTFEGKEVGKFPNGDLEIEKEGRTYRLSPDDIASPLKRSKVKKVIWKNGFEQFQGKVVGTFPNGDVAIEAGDSIYRHSPFNLTYP